MHLAFIDFVYAYDAGRPDTDEPLGGTTSAICFQARELVKAGISCTFFNRVTESRQAHGITTLPLHALSEEINKTPYDTYIFCGRWTDEFVHLVRENTKAPLIAWMHESAFIPPLTPALDDFDGVVFVSEWQKRVNQDAVRPHWKQTLIRNAMNPAVALSFPAEKPILGAKASPPILLFIGSFARGAFHIPPILDKIRVQRRDFSVEMFCNLDPSRNAETDAAYINWLRDQPNVTHVGMVGQPELSRRMRRATLLLAPNPWPETSCISLIEASASGLIPIITNRAALPETASGFARQIPIENPDEKQGFDMPIDYEAFAQATLAALRECAENPIATEANLRRQIDFFQAHYQWSQRVETWVEFVRGF